MTTGVAESRIAYRVSPPAELPAQREEAPVGEPRAIRPHLFTRAEFEKLIDLGFFEEDAKIELLNGTLIEMSPQGLPHSSTIHGLTKLLFRKFGDRADVRVQLPLAAGERSRPEPDFALVPPGRYREALPEQAYLVIEISDSTLRFDRQTKASIYAAHGVPEYWIVNLPESVVEVYTDPSEGRYRQVRTARRGEKLSLSAFEGVSLTVDEILG